MKKLLTLLLTGAMVFGLAACSSGGDTSTSAGSSAASTTSETSASDENAGTTQTTDLGNVLVVYYSASGHTEAVANTIADSTGGDLFALEPVDPYTDEDLNFNDENSRVVQEHDNPDQRDVELVSTTVAGWDDYDTVFIGYPIWWGIAAWPVDGFVENNDFTGKTVIPFCTSASSSIGQSGELLAEAAGTGDWQEGQRFTSNVSGSEVRDWVESLSA